MRAKVAFFFILSNMCVSQFHILAGSGITRASGAASALAASLSGLTALRILDLSGTFSLAVFRDCSNLLPDNDITGFNNSHNQTGHGSRKYGGDPQEIAEVVACISPFLPSLARLHDLESLDLSGRQTGAFVKILDPPCLCVLLQKRRILLTCVQDAACNTADAPTPLCPF